MSDEFFVGKSRIRLMQGDITGMDVDAIVNAANSTLMGGGGVDGAIHRAGGPQILKECKRLRAGEWPRGLPTGKAVMTSGGEMKAKFVVHTVGPVWRDGKGDEAKLLAEGYQNCLELVVSKGLRSIAFPSISTGAYGYPIEEASRIALGTAKKFLEQGPSLNVVFVLFSEHDFEVYSRVARNLLRS